MSYNARLCYDAAVLKVLDGPNPPPTFDAVELQITRLLCQARLDPARSAEAAAFMRTHADGAHLSQAIQGLVQVGRIDEAFDLAEADLNEIRNTQDFTSVFFRPFMAKFLASPRFMPLAARLGLVDIWRKTGLWPDYCSGPTAPYDCKAEAAKAMAKAA